MILLTLTLGSRNYFLPESPNDRVLHQKILKILFDAFTRPLCSLSFQFPATEISIWITTYTCRSYNHSLLLLLLQISSNCSPTFKNSLCHCLTYFCRTSTPTNNWSHLSRIWSFLVVHVFHKILRSTIRFSENPQQPIAPEFLASLHYG